MGHAEVIDPEYDTLRDWLQMKWICGHPTSDDILRYDDWLGLPPQERAARYRHMTEDDTDFWVEIDAARALHVDPIDREGGITDAKVARYRERHQWGSKDSS